MINIYHYLISIMNNKDKEYIWIQKQLTDIEEKRKEKENDIKIVEFLSNHPKEKTRVVPTKLKFNISKRYNYIYLIYSSTIGITGKRIYKYGKTYNIMSRFHQYPIDSTVIFLCRVVDCHYVEDEIYKLFLRYFKQNKEYGKEYFTASNVEEMINYMNQLIDFMRQRVDDDNTKKIINGYKNVINFRIDEKTTKDLGNNLIQYYATKKNGYISKIKNSEVTSEKKHNVLYICYKCHKKFTRKPDYRRHLNRKISCDKSIINDNDSKLDAIRINIELIETMKEVAKEIVGLKKEVICLKKGLDIYRKIKI
jgi:hypothetical protein